MKLKIVKVLGQRDGNQVIQIRPTCTKAVFCGTKKACLKYLERVQ